MDKYDFTYEIPDNIQNKLVQYFQLNGPIIISQALRHCTLDFQDIGFAYYAGIKGDTWNKKALDISIGGQQNDIRILKDNKMTLVSGINMMLKPSITGYLVHDVILYYDGNNIDVSLPEEKGETFEVLSEDIKDALEKDQPSLVLDRLHTFTTKIIREISKKHGLPISNNGNSYPLHSLAGALVSYYKRNDILESEFSEQALKMSISVFEKFNGIRNDQSYAHDNEILNKIEAKYVVKVVSATISLLYDIESYNDTPS